MAKEVIQNIPARLKNMAIGGHVAGADDIMDDDLGMTQDAINKIVFSSNITVGLTSSVSTVFARTPISVPLTAASNVKANEITIKKDGVSQPLATAENVSSLSYTHTLNPVVGSNVYRATFKYSGISDKTATKTVTGADKIFYGLGTASMDNYDSITSYCPVRTSPTGAVFPYNPTVGSYCYILIPTSMSNGIINTEKIKIVSSGLGYVMSLLSGTITKDGTTYKVYRGDEPNNSTEAFSLTIAS